MGGHHPEGHIIEPRNARTEKSRRQQQSGGVAEGGQGPRRGCSAIGGWMNFFADHWFSCLSKCFLNNGFERLVGH